VTYLVVQLLLMLLRLLQMLLLLHGHVRVKLHARRCTMVLLMLPLVLVLLRMHAVGHRRHGHAIAPRITTLHTVTVHTAWSSTWTCT
jgi:hypothetical protein